MHRESICKIATAYVGKPGIHFHGKVPGVGGCAYDPVDVSISVLTNKNMTCNTNPDPQYIPICPCQGFS